MDYLASEPVLKEFTERTLFLPAHKGVLAGKLDFNTDNEQVKAALEAYVAAASTTSAVAQKLPGWRWSDTYYGALVTRIGEAVAGELSLDQAFTRIDADIAAKVKDASR
jgi:alpha-1,4-digalacturonate transport system substrate-binding protein